MRPKYVEAIIEQRSCGICLGAPLRAVGRIETIAEQMLQRPVWPAGEMVAIIKLEDLDRLLAHAPDSYLGTDLLKKA